MQLIMHLFWDFFDYVERPCVSDTLGFEILFLIGYDNGPNETILCGVVPV